jgi:putative ABC transport system permease protein
VSRSPVNRSKVRFGDAVSIGTYGLRSRRGRSALTALGIAIGIAAIVAVFGISSSSRADVLAQIDELGTDLLMVRPGDDMFGERATLPVDAPAMIRRIPPVTAATAVSSFDADVQRNDLTDIENALDVLGAETNLLSTLEGRLAEGVFLNDASSELPVVVLGSVAAQRLGITDLAGGPTVSIAGTRFTVVGILDPFPLHPDLDRAVMIGVGAAETFLDADVIPTRVYLRVEPEYVEDVRAVLGRTTNPAAPNEVEVSRPSDALEARARVDEGLQRLLIGLGAVALVVGGVGVANVMVISVLERRGEVGLRRALGAARHHVAMQFLTESAFLSTIGGMLGVGLGAAATAWYANRQGWRLDVPLEVLGLSIVVALLLGVVAGLYPAIRAARLDPATAVRPTS